jgi:hypothetical protein
MPWRCPLGFGSTSTIRQASHRATERHKVPRPSPPMRRRCPDLEPGQLRPGAAERHLEQRLGHRRVMAFPDMAHDKGSPSTWSTRLGTPRKAVPATVGPQTWPRQRLVVPVNPTLHPPVFPVLGRPMKDGPRCPKRDGGLEWSMSTVATSTNVGWAKDPDSRRRAGSRCPAATRSISLANALGRERLAQRMNAIWRSPCWQTRTGMVRATAIRARPSMGVFCSHLC